MTDMKKALKKIFCIFPILMAMIFLLPIFSSVKYADATNYRGDYIAISFENEEEKIKWSLDFGLSTEAGGFADEGEKATYRLRMQIMVQKIYDDMKSEYLFKYNTALNGAESEEGKQTLEIFNPNNIEVLKTPLYDYKTDSVGFTLLFPSSQVYYFYRGEEVVINKNIFLTT